MATLMADRCQTNSAGTLAVFLTEQGGVWWGSDEEGEIASAVSRLNRPVKQ